MVHWIKSDFWYWQLASDREVSAALPSDFLCHPPQSPTDTLSILFFFVWLIDLFVYWGKLILRSCLNLLFVSSEAVSHGPVFMCFTWSPELKVTLHTGGFTYGGGSFVHSAAWLPISASCCSPCLLRSDRLCSSGGCHHGVRHDFSRQVTLKVSDVRHLDEEGRRRIWEELGWRVKLVGRWTTCGRSGIRSGASSGSWRGE